jgi:hypothetical protein
MTIFLSGSSLKENIQCIISTRNNSAHHRARQRRIRPMFGLLVLAGGLITAMTPNPIMLK